MAPSPCYIHAASAISPQLSFSPAAFLQPLLTSGNNQLYVQDAPYKEFISPVAIRRMSRMLKFSISAAMKAYQDAGEGPLHGILTGTGNGSITDMQHFLMEMINLQEDTLNPTAFIQSTFNSPNGWIAMQTKCSGYNQCFLHRGISFELALLDARLLLEENEQPHRLLVGCYDELTSLYYTIKEKIDYWKKEKIESSELFRHRQSTGTIGGEGAAFFVISNQAAGALAQIKGLHILQDQSLEQNLASAIEKLLQETATPAAEINLILSGENGDSRSNAFYDQAYAALPRADVACFKHLSGEYDTATGFGLWAAVQVLQSGEVPQEMMKGQRPQVRAKGVKNILLVNKAIRGGSTLILLGR